MKPPTPFPTLLSGVMLVALTSLAFDVGRAADDTVGFNEIATVHREVIVPIPSEVFNVLDQFDVTRNQWRTQLKVPEEERCEDRLHFALFLGRVVAEGFLAVEAQDREAIRTLGRTVLSVAEELGLREAVIKHSKSIIEEADQGDWEAVRAEFDATRHTVRAEMERRRDQDLSHCVSVGGWLRGTEIITAIIKDHYSTKTSEILHQPQLLDHFTTTFKENRRFQRDSRLRKVIATLEALQPLMGREGDISRAEVARIHSICQQIRLDTLTP